MSYIVREKNLSEKEMKVIENKEPPKVILPVKTVNKSATKSLRDNMSLEHPKLAEYHKKLDVLIINESLTSDGNMRKLIQWEAEEVRQLIKDYKKVNNLGNDDYIRWNKG